MNYMKILLIYMAATMSLAVQSTTAPVETPVPTPAPVLEQQQEQQAEGTDADVPIIGVETVQAAAPSETPPPVPEITPNKKYHNLKKGDKGSDVKALQKRLIELGYLPEGSADGNFGNQTYKAVRNFQYYNGLTRDGIAGKKTQTYLFENPDVNPYPTETPAPEETPAPTETPAPADTPEEIPEATPTEKPTEAPTETPAEETTEAPTEKPSEKPTEKLTPEPEEKPTEEPQPTPDRTAGAPVTSAPATEAPVEKPTMAVEEIDPEDLHFTEAAGSIAYNDDTAPLSWMATEDGVPVLRKPRIQRREGNIRVSLGDLAECIEGWTLSAEGNNVVLEAEGHTLALLSEDAGMVMTVDGIEKPVENTDFDFAEGYFINAEFLAEALGGRAVWVEEENTLMLRIPEKK